MNLTSMPPSFLPSSSRYIWNPSTMSFPTWAKRPVIGAIKPTRSSSACANAPNKSAPLNNSDLIGRDRLMSDLPSADLPSIFDCRRADRGCSTYPGPVNAIIPRATGGGLSFWRLRLVTARLERRAHCFGQRGNLIGLAQDRHPVLAAERLRVAACKQDRDLRVAFADRLGQSKTVEIAGQDHVGEHHVHAFPGRQ